MIKIFSVALSVFILQDTPEKDYLHYKLNNPSNKNIQYSQKTADG